MRVVVTAGGTGGHIYPAISIINKLKEHYKDLDLLYIGTTNRMESKLIPSLKIKYLGLDIIGLNRKNIFKNIDVLKRYFKSKQIVKKTLKEFKPDIVIGAGGYVTAPVIEIAHKFGIKTLIHEQNSIPGVTNKILSKYVDCICISLIDSKKYFNRKNVIYTGNPRSEEIIKAAKLNKEELGFDKEKKLVVIVMGSLGSTTMTQKLKETIIKFDNCNYQVLVITGQNYFDDYKEVKLPKNVRVLPFMDNLINLLKDTDLLVSRAGASTLAEVCAIALPTIMVPSPYVTGNHQYKNAKELEEKGACYIIEEKDFNSDILLNKIDEILFDEKKYNSMKEALRKLAVNDSSSRILKCIINLVGDNHEN